MSTEDKRYHPPMPSPPAGRAKAWPKQEHAPEASSRRSEMQRPPRLLDQLRLVLKTKRYSPHTVEAYVRWVHRFILFNGTRHPCRLTGLEISNFLSNLAVEGEVSASTQAQALSAIMFLYHHVLHVEPGSVDKVIRAGKPKRLPVVLTREEVPLLAELRAPFWAMGMLMYGSGLRLMECLQCMIHDRVTARPLLRARTPRARFRFRTA